MKKVLFVTTLNCDSPNEVSQECVEVLTHAVTLQLNWGDVVTSIQPPAFFEHLGAHDELGKLHKLLAKQHSSNERHALADMDLVRWVLVSVATCLGA